MLGNKIKIIDFLPCHKNAFYALNEAWISKYFKLEPVDIIAIDNPQEYIIEKGGAIKVALYNEEPIGVCALIKMNDPQYKYELAKLAVSPKMQGHGVGRLLCESIIAKAKELGANKLYLETNSQLVPAITLYHSLGFIEVKGRITPYKRSDYQMEYVF